MPASDQDLTEDETPAALESSPFYILRDHIQGQRPQGLTGPERTPSSLPSGQPDPLGEFEEDDQPDTGRTVLSKPFNPQEGMHKTRTRLAMGLLILVGVLALAPTIALIFGDGLQFTTEDYREVNSMFTPVIALASAAFGFFFASDDRTRP
ncbi:hypothetical protein [Streptomyces sp. GESEQ-4]|uniref:hypothetical protein n=1 Tax=Streptomyces sp. GESEQ-4 TaxID=2812655 RepID=UPI001B3429CF|nr:hypothetical protein [Streptomyces sp. GESEQ-4]